MAAELSKLEAGREELDSTEPKVKKKIINLQIGFFFKIIFLDIKIQSST